MELVNRIEAPAVPDALTFGQSVELNGALYGVIEQCNIDRAAIRKIESSK